MAHTTLLEISCTGPNIKRAMLFDESLIEILDTEGVLLESLKCFVTK